MAVNDKFVFSIENKNSQKQIQENLKLEELTQTIERQSKELIRQQKLAIIGELTSSLFHDLRSTLSVIQVTIENLMELSEINDLKKFNKIQHSIDKINHQVNNVLDYINNKPIIVNKTKSSKIILDSINSLTIPDNIKIITPKNDLDIVCNKEQLSVVMDNLILNSIQSIKKNGVITIKVKKNQDYIIFEIEDSGRGISEEYLPHIFEPFFTTRKSGTGLGLVSCKKIIEKHGGSISVKSKMNQGTKFTMKLPC